MIGMAKKSKKPVRIPSPKELKSKRKSLGLTQAEIAAKLGVARRTFQDWELGVTSMPATAALLLDCLEHLKS